VVFESRRQADQNRDRVGAIEGCQEVQGKIVVKRHRRLAASTAQYCP
jgi:hypothetical protein